ncbi:MAG: hypothetical protein ACLQDY_21685 [Streptosporangiaceae bacterium]
MTSPATGGSAAATRGATLPPRLCPAMKMRAASTAGCPRSRRMAAAACGTYSSVSVKVRSAATRSACALVTFSNRRTAIPALARPQARSLSGLLRPVVSSRSCGPEAGQQHHRGHWPALAGRLSVPGTATGPSPTVTSSSVNLSGLA